MKILLNNGTKIDIEALMNKLFFSMFKTINKVSQYK